MTPSGSFEAPAPDRGARRRRRVLAIAGLALGGETLALWARGYRLGGNVVVRCQRDHLYTTLWVPGGSLKSLRLGLWRFQRCPVGGHWSFVTPVRRAGLSDEQARDAGEQRDIRIP